MIGWTGMRGGVSLAAALALPELLADGTRFPHRNLILFLAFFVICVTLLLQGITLPPLIRALRLGASAPDGEEQFARRMVIEAATWHGEDAKKSQGKESEPLFDDLIQHYRQRLASLQPDVPKEDIASREHYFKHFQDALRIERETAIRLRDENRINDEVLR